jgi:hypothetical protein
MIVPDCTLTTACFDLTKYHAKSRPLEVGIENMRALLEVPCYLVIYTDTSCLPYIQAIRKPFDTLTVYIVQSFETTPYYHLVGQVKVNRANYWPTRDERTCAESHLLVCSKNRFLLQTMDSNPFRTSKFGWIDAHLGANFSKIAEDYTPDLLLQCLHEAGEKWHMQILNVNDKKYLRPENKAEFYQQYRWVMCGCFYTTGQEVGRRIVQRLHEVFLETTAQGFGHAEEMTYLEILEEFYDDIERSYGDYGQILNNYLRPTRNIRYIYECILKRYLHFGYYKEALECSGKLVKGVEENLKAVDPELYFFLLFSQYLATFYTDRVNARKVVEKINDVCNNTPAVMAQFNKNRAFYEDQFKFVL